MKDLTAIYVIGIIVNVVAVIVCPIIAHNKGRSAVGWFFGGLFLSGLGIIIISCLSDKSIDIRNIVREEVYANARKAMRDSSFSAPVSIEAEEVVKNYIENDKIVRSLFSEKMKSAQICKIKAISCINNTPEDAFTYTFVIKGNISTTGNDEINYFRAVVRFNKASGYCNLINYSIS